MIDLMQSMDAMVGVKPAFDRRLAVDDHGARPFAQLLQQATGGQTRREIAREAATQLVAAALIMPVLESMRDSPMLRPPFAPGLAEKRFAPLLDQQIADRIAGAANFSLVDQIVDRLLGPITPPSSSNVQPSQEPSHGLH